MSLLYGMLDLVNMLDWFIKQGVVSKLTANGVFLAYVLSITAVVDIVMVEVRLIWCMWSVG